MCNGSGSVRSSSSPRVVEREVEVEVHPKYLVDIKKVPRQTYSKLNKNEFELISTRLVKYLIVGEAQKAAVCYNHLADLAAGQEHESELKLLRDLDRNVRKPLEEAFGHIDKGDGLEANLDQAFNRTVLSVSRGLALCYSNYF